MELTVIKALTISEAWWRCLQECLAHGYEYTITSGSSGTEGKKRKELDSIAIQITNPSIRPLVPDVPQGVPPPTSDEYLQNYLHYLLTSAKMPNEEYTYGEYLEPQFTEVVDMYKRGGHHTNQACMTVGDRNSISLKDPPCLRLVDTRVRYGRLHWYVYFRSWDLWGAFPTNMGGLQLAKEMMADMIGVEDGELLAFSKGLHIYDSEWEVAEMVVRRAP
jgi:thymidylate synthase